jgi:FkbM family methyltransferase
MGSKQIIIWIYLLITHPNRIKLLQWIISSRRNPTAITEFTLKDGSKFLYPLDSAIGGALSYDDFEPLELSFVTNNLEEGDIFLDIGANGGLFTIAAAKKVGAKGHVYAFEPSEREQSLLQHNIEINRLDNVTIVKAAVGDKNDTIKFVISQDGAMNSLKQNEHPGQKYQNEVEVSMIALDKFATDNDISNVKLIKIDVEGAELLVFQGAEQLLASTKPIILFEANDLTSRSFGYSQEYLLSFLSESEYVIQTWDKNEKITNIQDTNGFFKKRSNFIARRKY